MGGPPLSHSRWETSITLSLEYGGSEKQQVLHADINLSIPLTHIGPQGGTRGGLQLFQKSHSTLPTIV